MARLDHVCSRPLARGRALRQGGLCPSDAPAPSSLPGLPVPLTWRRPGQAQPMCGLGLQGCSGWGISFTFLKRSCRTKRSSPLCTINWGIPWKVPCLPGEEPGMASPPCASRAPSLPEACSAFARWGWGQPPRGAGVGGESGSGLCRARLGPSLPSPASLEQSSSGPRVSPKTPPPLPTLPQAAACHTLPEGGLRSHFP